MHVLRAQQQQQQQGEEREAGVAEDWGQGELLQDYCRLCSVAGDGSERLGQAPDAKAMVVRCRRGAGGADVTQRQRQRQRQREQGRGRQRQQQQWQQPHRSPSVVVVGAAVTFPCDAGPDDNDDDVQRRVQRCDEAEC
ncbi:hypothetical protein J1614_006270 [Plenodomus biglobosus]|nr:hypothetical protein J1614_006270 [Plenodomus biglobosus]